MTWFRVDDGFARHPKVKALRKFGPRRRSDALALWLLAGAECASALGQGGVRDGFVSVDDLEELARPLAGTPLVLATDALVEVGLWHREPDGFTFHDWEHRQPSSDKVKQRRDGWREQKERQRSGKRGVSAADSAQDNTPDTPADASAGGAMSAADSGADSPKSPERSPSRARAGIPSRPGPTRPDPDLDREGDLDQVAREPNPMPSLTPAQSLTRDAETIRRAAQGAFERAGVVPPRAVRDLDGKPWVTLVEPLRVRAEHYGVTLGEVADALLAGFLASERARERGYPIGFLVANPSEYLTTRTEPVADLQRLLDGIPKGSAEAIPEDDGDPFGLRDPFPKKAKART